MELIILNKKTIHDSIIQTVLSYFMVILNPVICIFHLFSSAANQ